MVSAVCSFTGLLAARKRRVSVRAFSLIELLVVMSVISLLVALAVPVFVRAHSSAMFSICQHRLQSWGTAFQMYVTENEGVYPHTDGADRDDGPADQYGWVDVLPPLIGRKPWRDHQPGSLPGAGTFYQCPAARLAPEEAYDYRPRTVGYFSYAMNSCLELDRDCWRPHDGRGWPMPSFLDTDRIADPARLVLLFDQLLDPELGYDATKRYRSAGEHCGSYPKSFSARHASGGRSLGGSILFCDSHVEWRQSVWKPNWPEDLEVPPREDPEWFPYPP